MASQRLGKDEMSLLDFVIVLAKHKMLVLGIPFLSSVVAMVVAFSLTPTYTATTRILPPQQAQSSAVAMLGQLGALAGGAGGVLGLKSPGDLYIGLLKSETIATRIVERFGLRAQYGARFLSDARRSLEANSKIGSGKDGLITIEVEDVDPARAAALANAYVDELVKFTTILAVTEAGQRRLFFERQMLQTKDGLIKAELAARAALTEGGIATVDAQGRSLIETAATLRAQIASKEVQMNAMRAFATENNPEFVRVSQELVALRQQVARIEGSGGAVRGVRKQPSTTEGLHNVSLLRDVKYHEVLFELLAKQYELAKIDEAKDSSIIQVVDVATVPERKSRPRRLLIVLLTGIVTGLLGVLLALLGEARQRVLNDPAQRERAQVLRGYLMKRV